MIARARPLTAAEQSSNDYPLWEADLLATPNYMSTGGQLKRSSVLSLSLVMVS